MSDSDTDRLAVEAAATLATSARHSVSEALGAVPDAPGLYAFYASARACSDLGLGPASDASALYVGKAEASLVSRDLKTHFATGKTGSSTVRRSFAALLSERLDLHAVPRNLAKPDGSANFGLETTGDERLTQWMHDHLSLAVWEKPTGAVLDAVETAVLAAWQPPLNLSKVARPWPQLRAARARMAAEARGWTPPE
jgi:hypothetical protein